MNIIKSLHPSLLYKTFTHQEKHYFTVSVLWGFNLNTGEPVLEQALWQTIGDLLGKNEMFDTGMPKPNAELMVQGSCFAASGETVKANRVSVSLGSLTKELMVFGDRHWIKGMGVGWGLSDPEPFTEMPISYSNAFGGKDYAPNPVGKGLDEVDGDTGPVIPVPNIEYADQLIGSPKDKPRPASMNRIDMMCEQRLSYGGTYDQKYIETRMPGFPDDLDYKSFNDAAKDQWFDGYFNGDEQYEIRNMNPEHPVIKGQIPGVYGRAFVNHKVKDEVIFKEIPTKLDTVWLFPGTEIGVMIHRGVLEVNEDDACDIKQILIANENTKDTPRTPEHYQNELSLRTDPKEGFKYMLYTSPLIPEGVTCGYKSIQENADFPLEMLSKENIDNFTEAKEKELKDQADEQLVQMKKQLTESGLPAEEVDKLIKQLPKAAKEADELSPEAKQIAAIMEKVLPGLAADPKNLDISKLNLKAMDELTAYMDKLQQDKKDESKAALLKQIDEMKSDSNPEVVKSAAPLEKMVKEMALPPVLPRINVDEIIQQMKSQQAEMEKQLLVMQSMGLPEEELKKIKGAMNDDEVEQKTRESLDKANEGYRLGAHCMDKARSPHEGKEKDKREELIKAHKAGGKTSHGDYAFVDLSNLDLTGIDLSGAYLEYADLSNTNLTNANLNKAILVHANFKNTILTNTSLVDANLGAIVFDTAVFKDADLTGATLSKSAINNTEFINCKMAEKSDMFLETTFDKASFTGSDMRKNVFIDADISGCDFSGADISESTFINPIMKGVVCSNANLSSTLFVTADADSSKFDKAIMKNVRFVAESSLNNADFQLAEVNEANLRDCKLQNAKFNEAYLHKTDFGGADLKKASFESTRAVEAQFSKADLTHANLNKMDLMEGSLYKAVLSGASLINANLYSVSFSGCTVGQTDFTGAYLEKTIFKDWRP